MKIFLIGFMGAGKTTLGKELSRKMMIPFFDLDHIIEEGENLSIPDIFRKMGEESFRVLEGKYLKEYPFPDTYILSAGGGTPCFFDHMDYMNQIGHTFYLQLSPKSLANRLMNAKDPIRPLINDKTGDELILFIEEKLKEREKFYLKAHTVLKGENLKAEDISVLLKPLL